MPTGKRKKPAFITHKTTAASRRRSKSPPAVKRRHLNFSYKSMGNVSVSESLSVVKEEAKPTAEDPFQGASSDWLNQGESDPAYQELLAGVMMDEPSVVKVHQTEVGGSDLSQNSVSWLPLRETYLEELVNHEGRGYNPPEWCQNCSDSAAIYRCQSCFRRELVCKECIVEGHKHLLFHRIQQWNGSFFVSVSLRSLGLIIQLNHRGQHLCSNPEANTGDVFTVIDLDGIHSVSVNFCACGYRTQSRYVQLLRTGLFPVTSEHPQAAITFRTLELFELLSYESKVSAFEYYRTLSRLTDNTGMKAPPDRYASFSRTVRIWRHLKMLKRSGRGHDPEGVVNTREGDCALRCPACPQPGMNLPDGWEATGEDKRWLYSLFVALDANFRLKRKDVSNDKRDAGLSLGWAFIVNNEPYKEHLARYKDEVEPKSNCSRHDAVNLSSSKPHRNHAATGIATVECARHNMKRPNAIADLQKGERYCNMDYIFHKSLSDCKIKDFVISYDIACQWSINLNTRLQRIDSKFADTMFNDRNTRTRFFVPKFHLPAHVARCRTRYSFNYSKDVGRTDGEAPERGWAEINPIASSTKEMGPGYRRDTLDSHFNDYNWRKIINLGKLRTTLLRKVKEAGADKAEFTSQHDQLESSLPPDALRQWKEEVEAWERDPSSSNPFEQTIMTPTMVAVRHELAEQEAKLLAAGQDYTQDASVSPSVFISTSLEIEGEQRTLKVEYSRIWEHAQDRQITKYQLNCNRLVRKFNAWEKHQQLYMPAAASMRSGKPLDMAPKKTDEPYDICLWLPSEFARLKASTQIDHRLLELEWKFRIAQAYEALDQIRHNLQVRAHVFKFKDRFVRGQGANTRARDTISTIQSAIDSNRDTYRAARSALTSLGNVLGHSTGWESQLPLLMDSDIRGISDGEDGQSEGKKQLSWIWKVMGVIGKNDGDLHLRDSLRIEWCKSRARAMRFSEEVELLLEEMRRVLQFFEWQESWWLDKAEQKNDLMSTMRTEGLQAYAMRQATLRADLCKHFSHMWQYIPAYVNLTS
ncbi:hypothetical protein JOM56_010083 [Amanita muscaria]